jgi:hypothetical protein
MGIYIILPGYYIFSFKNFSKKIKPKCPPSSGEGRNEEGFSQAAAQGAEHTNADTAYELRPRRIGNK